jgi:hypothetical protein
MRLFYIGNNLAQFEVPLLLLVVGRLVVSVVGCVVFPKSGKSIENPGLEEEPLAALPWALACESSQLPFCGSPPKEGLTGLYTSCEAETDAVAAASTPTESIAMVMMRILYLLLQ